jgi:F0F1-type ATP synthase membrane subunit c/vacuolar-type H+-ATPase subunit K
MTKAWRLAALLLVVCGLGGLAWAQVDANSPGTAGPRTAEGDKSVPWADALKTIGACLGAALAAGAGGYGVSKIGRACIESIARQPEAARDMFAPMVVAAGMVEVGMLFAIVVCLLSLYGG